MPPAISLARKSTALATSSADARRPSAVSAARVAALAVRRGRRSRRAFGCGPATLRLDADGEGSGGGQEWGRRSFRKLSESSRLLRRHSGCTTESSPPPPPRKNDVRTRMGIPLPSDALPKEAGLRENDRYLYRYLFP
jgi:hypothetical protein